MRLLTNEPTPLLLLGGEQPRHKTSRISTARSRCPLKFTAMFHTRDLTWQLSPKGYIFCLNDFAHLRLSLGEITWKCHCLQPKLPHVWIEKNSKIVFCPRHCSEDYVRLRVPFPVFERKHVHKCVLVGRDSAVGIATRYGLDGPVIESQWGAKFSAPVQTGHGAHRASYTMGTCFPGDTAAGAWRWPPTPI